MTGLSFDTTGAAWTVTMTATGSLTVCARSVAMLST